MDWTLSVSAKIVKYQLRSLTSLTKEIVFKNIYWFMIRSSSGKMEHEQPNQQSVKKQTCTACNTQKFET